LECLDAIVGYTSEGRSRFLAGRKTQKATLRDYLGISLSRVWDITQRDLLALRAAILLMLAETEPHGLSG
jgi:uncharacterized protein with HEPN domain